MGYNNIHTGKLDSSAHMVFTMVGYSTCPTVRARGMDGMVVWSAYHSLLQNKQYWLDMDEWTVNIELHHQQQHSPLFLSLKVRK
jgi:hypothetical protein